MMMILMMTMMMVMMVMMWMMRMVCDDETDGTAAAEICIQYMYMIYMYMCFFVCL